MGRDGDVPNASRPRLGSFDSHRNGSASNIFPSFVLEPMTIVRKREGPSPKFSASVWKDSFGETEALAVRTFAIPFLQTRPDSALR